MQDRSPATAESLSPTSEHYKRLWSEGERAMRTSACRPDSPPSEGDPRWGLSVVIPIDGEPRDRLLSELPGIRAACRTRHVHYAGDNLHCTVRSLEGYQETVPAEQVDYYAQQVAGAVADLPPLRLTLRGLSGSPGGVFACGYATSALPTLRNRLHQAARHRGALAVPGADADRVRDTAHVSMLVFQHPVVPEPALADYLAARRDLEYGGLDVTALALVRYRWRDSTIHMEELERVRLPGR